MTTQACLSADLIVRIRARITQDWRRTGDGDWMRMPKERRPKPAVDGLMGTMLGALFSYEPPDMEALKPVEPLADKTIAKIEKALGFPLPGDLKQLYLEIGDGGFGPYNGVRRLSNWAKDYQKLVAEPIGERKRVWPAELLPIVYLNGHRVCMNRDSGAIVRWTKPPARCSEAKWTASFAPQSSSLGEWLERWVDTPTQVEGGPEGGWSPSAIEAERRARAETDRQARIDAEGEKAREFAVAELPPLPEALIERVRERARDPRRRTFLAGAAGATPIGLDDLEDELVKAADAIPRQAISGLAGILTGLRGMGPLAGAIPGLAMVRGPVGAMMMKSGSGGRLGPPATAAAFAHAAARLGFGLPVPLQQLYAIADGGFGPGDTGLFSLADLLTRHRKLNGAPHGPSGEPWPAKLLPLYESDPALGCLDLENGKVVVYDPERVEDIHGGAWRRSFVTEHESMAGLLEAWLADPCLADQLERRESRCEQRVKQPYRAFSDPAQQADAELRYYGFMPPALRAAAGLPETGWEDEIRRRHGLI